jgi:hypothetical protein
MVINLERLSGELTGVQCKNSNFRTGKDTYWWSPKAGSVADVYMDIIFNKKPVIIPVNKADNKVKRKELSFMSMS